MHIENVEISGDCRLAVEKHEDIGTYLTLEYINRATDQWSSDEDISLDIDKEKGAEIVAFLTEHLGL
tara:strand:+ start:1461 stop:1661 length:201 start_codon:yes stop_codon:yes gene_type:complete